jgi:hypothetical protein
MLILACLAASTLALPPVEAQQSGVLFGIGHPVWPNDRNGNPVDIQNLVNLVKRSGGNTWREAMYVGSNVDSYYLNLKSYCDQAGVNFVIQTLSASVQAMTYAQETEIILGGSAQANWISSWGAKIQILHPYGIMVMNEPTNGGTHQVASQSRFNSYRQFCMNTITAWRLIQPDLVIFVNNDPFNDFYDSTAYGFAAQPLPYSNVLYGRHIYYAYDGQYPPSYLPDQQNYWNGNTAQGKELLSQLIESESSALRMKGQTVIWDEWGAAVAAPHADDYVRDFVSICNSKNIGSLYYDLVPASYEQSGILNEDYRTLNIVGLAWASVAPTSTPTPMPTVTPLPSSSPVPTSSPIANNPGGDGSWNPFSPTPVVPATPSPSYMPTFNPNGSSSNSVVPFGDVGLVGLIAVFGLGGVYLVVSRKQPRSYTRRARRISRGARKIRRGVRRVQVRRRRR